LETVRRLPVASLRCSDVGHNDSQVFGGNGDDTINARAVSPTFTSDLFVSGGNGDDTVLLDAGNSVALGGNGDDVLTSIGGLGNELRGGNGDDLLVSFGGGSGMGQGNTLTGGLDEDTFRFTNAGNLVVTVDAGNDRAVSDGDVFLGPTDAITDYRAGELIELRTFGGAEDVPPYTRIESVALIDDPIASPDAAGRFRPVVGDGQYALVRGDFAGGGVFNVDSGGDDLLVVYDSFNGADDNIAQGSLVLLGATDPDSVLIG
jgi:hypothetical protein